MKRRSIFKLLLAPLLKLLPDSYVPYFTRVDLHENTFVPDMWAEITEYHSKFGVVRILRHSMLEKETRKGKGEKL